MSDSQTISSTARNVFLFAILAYLILWVAVLVFLWQMFGAVFSLILSVLVGFPLVIALWMYPRFQSVKKREWIFLLILFCFAFLGSVYVIFDNFQHGLHLRHAEHLRRARLADFLHEDPAFENVKLVDDGKFCSFEGTVATEADLERLRSLITQYDVDWMLFLVEVKATLPAKSSD